MFISKKHIPRRTFLRGSGVTLALPFLESMLPAQTPLRQTAASPGSVRRFVGIWHFLMDYAGGSGIQICS